jgi:uncharacterized membrane protein
MDNKTDTIYKTKRFFEIDFIKGIATIFMIIFHFFYLMYFMDIEKYDIDNGILKFFSRFAHGVFILMVGVNLSVSYKKMKEKYRDLYDNKRSEFMNMYTGKIFKRSMYILLFGFIMTLLSYLGFGHLFIKFGIFHFIGVSLLLSLLVTPYKYNSAIITGVIVLLYVIINITKVADILRSSCQNLPLVCFITGLFNVKYTSLDYFPLIPFFALITLGIFIGDSLYTTENGTVKRKYLNTSETENFDNVSKNYIVEKISCIGANSFKIYFIHFILFYFILLGYKHYIINKHLPDTNIITEMLTE